MHGGENEEGHMGKVGAATFLWIWANILWRTQLGAPQNVTFLWRTSRGAPQKVGFLWRTSHGAPQNVHFLWRIEHHAPQKVGPPDLQKGGTTLSPCM